jgi:alanine racemase
MEPSVAESELVIRRSALRANLRTVRQLVGGAKLIAVVKANAYGHGLRTVGPWMLEDGADLLAVATLEEAVGLRAALPDGCARVLVLGGVLPHEAPEALESGATIAVQDLCVAEALSRAAERRDTTARVHLKVDTGMSRLGVEWFEAVDAARRLAGLPNVRLTGAMTHLATADDENEAHAREQLDRWRGVCEGLRADLVLHCLATAGILRFPEWSQGAVRPGLILYGIDRQAGVPCPPLEPALTMEARLMQVKEIAEGESVSYGATFTASRPTRIGVVPIGYADGWPRTLSGRGCVVIRGVRAPVLGRVCMDRFMVDLTRLPEAAMGDTVTLLGPELDVNEVAALAGTIHHEILVRLGLRVRRRYIDD